MQCYLEINTGICEDVAEAERDLTAKIRAVEEAARAQGMRLFWGGDPPVLALAGPGGHARTSATSGWSTCSRRPRGGW